MSARALEIIAPVESPLPPPPDGECLTNAQWTTFIAIADTVVPSIVVSSEQVPNKLSISSTEYAATVKKLKALISDSGEADLIQPYLEESPSALPRFKELLHRILGEYTREDDRKGFRVLLSSLDTRAGCLLATGYTTSFHLQPIHVRQQILQNWTRSYLPLLRKFANTMIRLTVQTWAKNSLALGPILGFPRAPVHGKPGKGFDYDFIQFLPGAEPEIVETDVVVVGSGCGGGVCAKNLAEAGHRVLVVEKAYHFPTEHLPMSESDAGVHLFMDGGLRGSDDGSINILAGQAFGGGGTVNWSASLQTQHFVRQEWAAGGLPFFTSSEFQKSLDRVCTRMGVSADHIQHNPNNEVLLEGARKLGYSARNVPQNTGGVKHYCGYCTLGCGAGEKQGPVVSFLPDSAKAGAKFIEGFEADKVLFDDVAGKKVATGIKGRWRSRDQNGGVSEVGITRDVVIRAKRVIVSAGTLQSPLLLLRSGLTNTHIGKHLHLHPVTVVGAVYPERTNPWEGGILTAVVDEFQNLDSHGHGAKIEAMTMIPSWFLPFAPWISGLDKKLSAAKMAYTGCHVVLVRDRDTGRVYPDAVDGKCRVEYTPSAFDKRHALEGAIASAKMAYVQGAKEIFLANSSLSTFIRAEEEHHSNLTNPSPADDDNDDEGTNNPKFQSWLSEIRTRGLNLPETAWGSAHQMGTCRMGSSPRNSVVDPRGKVWGVAEGLYVADASVFPSASGVNPMVTNMAISDWISRGVARGMRSRVGGEVRA